MDVQFTPLEEAAHRSAAKRFVDRIMENIGQPDWRLRRETAQVFTTDLKEDAKTLHDHLSFCAFFGEPFPCFETGEDEPIPIDFFSFGRSLTGDLRMRLLRSYRPYSEYYRSDYYRESYNRSRPFLKEVSVKSRMALVYVEPDEAKDFFRSRLMKFTINRFNAGSAGPSDNLGIYNYRPTSTRRGTGLAFRVVTSSPGLVVYYSPAYFIKSSLVFGSPTTPVDGHLIPGRYIFGVGLSKASRPVFSAAEFDVPPLTEAHLLEF